MFKKLVAALALGRGWCLHAAGAGPTGLFDPEMPRRGASAYQGWKGSMRSVSLVTARLPKPDGWPKFSTENEKWSRPSAVDAFRCVQLLTLLLTAERQRCDVAATPAARLCRYYRLSRRLTQTGRGKNPPRSALPTAAEGAVDTPPLPGCCAAT